MKKTKIIIALLLIWNLVLTIFVIYSKNSNTTIKTETVSGFSTDLTKVAEEERSSVVVVESSYGQQSGFIYKQVDNLAYIVTTFHGINDDTSVSVTFLNGKTFTARVVGYDFVSDIAVLSIEVPYKLNVVKCGDNEYLNAGEFIINIGTGKDEDYINNIELGIISNSLVNVVDNVTYNKENYSINKEVIAVSLNISEGYSGSPLFNMNNEVVGMVEMSNTDNVIYATSVNEIKIVSDLLINEKEVNKINFGMSGEYVQNLEEYEKNMFNLPIDIINGYYVKTVNAGKLASKLGIVNGDIIVSVDGKTIVSQKDLLNIVYSNFEGEITLSIIRNNETLELKGSIND